MIILISIWTRSPRLRGSATPILRSSPFPQKPARASRRSPTGSAPGSAHTKKRRRRQTHDRSGTEAARADPRRQGRGCAAGENSEAWQKDHGRRRPQARQGQRGRRGILGPGRRRDRRDGRHRPYHEAPHALHRRRALEDEQGHGGAEAAFPGAARPDELHRPSGIRLRLPL